MPKVDLLYFPSCPNIPAAREQLTRAFAALDLPAKWTEVDVSAEDAAEQVRGYGSPTILVDGKDVMGEPPSDGSTCRVYVASDLRGAPPLDVLVAALGAAEHACLCGVFSN
jgi:hypothetical protein